MSGLLLRVGGPLQSWGEASVFGDRDTAGFPTRSGLLGMFAAACGIPRGTPLTRFGGLRLTVRADDPGVPLADFHTVGGGLPAARTVPTASGGHRTGTTGTLVSVRHYLAGAVFTVGVDGDGGLVAELAAALAAPRWQLYLGRRGCPPDHPLLLASVGDAEDHVRNRVPLARQPGDPDTVDFYTEAPGIGGLAYAEVADTPGETTPAGRRHLPRRVYRETAVIPPGLAHPAGDEFRHALYGYIQAQR